MNIPVIWKYEFNGLEEVFEMPSSAEVLSFGYVQGKFVLWAKGRPENEKVKRTFRIYMTGEVDRWSGKDHFVGTAWTSDGGSFVGHCFEHY